MKASVRLHVDQTMRTRNFRARNEIVKRRTNSKGRRGKRAYVERKLETVHSGSKTDNVPRETRVVSPMTCHLETDGLELFKKDQAVEVEAFGEKGRIPLPKQES